MSSIDKTSTPAEDNAVENPEAAAGTVTAPCDKVEEMYKRFYFRPRKIGAIVGEMVRDFDMMKRRLREGVEFFNFLRNRKEAA